MIPFRLLVAGVLAAGAGAAPAALAQVGSDNFREAIEFTRQRIYPALVNIAVVAQEYDGGRARRYPAAGSGVIVSPAGHVITNYHVAGEAARVRCTLPTGESIEATTVGADPLTDLCILKLSLDKREDPTQPIPFATIGDSDRLEVGEHVIAVGNPLTLSSSMTLGVVSNKKRVFTDFTGTEITEFDDAEGQTTGLYNQWIQHDALILPGNSGGPLVNLRGEIVGINTRGGGGVGFALPSATIRQVLNQALTFGEVRRGWLGISVMPVSKLGLKHGALVSNVDPSSPAASIIEAGDVITAFDGAPVDVRFFDEVPLFHQQVAEMQPGRKLAIAFVRAAETRNATVEVKALDKFLGDEREFRHLGLTVRDVTKPMSISRGYPDDLGVVVTGVRPGFAFEEAKPKLDRGDVIRRVNGKDVADLAAFAALVTEFKDAPKLSITFRSGDEEMVTLVDTAKHEPPKGSKELPKAWLGAQTQVLTEKVAEAIGAAGKKGFRVTQVYPYTKAEESGLKVGDVLVAMDGTALTASKPQDADELKHAIEDMSIGDSLELDVLRDGTPLKVKVELEESPTSALDVKTGKEDDLEFKVRETTFMDRVKYKWPAAQKGVLVTETTPGGWANVAGLHVEDLLLQINGAKVESIAAFDARMKELTEAKPKLLQLFVRRGQRTYFVFIEPDWAKIEASK